MTKHLIRTLCYSGPKNACSMASAPDLSRTWTALETSSQSFIDAHKVCTHELPTNDEELNRATTDNKALDLAIFTASRQIYEEIFPIFWRTSRFCLETFTFVEFSSNLNEVQRDNVRNIVVLYSVEHCYPSPEGDWDMLYLETQEEWTVWRGKDAIEFPLCNLASFDIHLRLWGRVRAANSTRSQQKTILTVLRVLEQLGSRTLQDVSLTISNDIIPIDYAFGNRPTQQHMSDLITNFRKRLTSGAERDSTLIERLAGDIRKSDALADEFRATMIACRKKGDVFNEKATECREKAEEYVEKSTELMKHLREQLSIEIEDELDSSDM